MPSPQAQDKWEQYAEPASTDKWEQYAEKTPTTSVIPPPPPPNVSAKPSASPFAMIGEGIEAEGAGREQMAREHPGALASVALAGLPLPTKGLAGLATNVLSRGAGALGGAAYGGRLASEAGLPRWAGQAVGGAVGLFAPEVIGKLSGPLISRIATVLGKSAPEVATVIAEDSTLANKVGRDVVERAARGEPLTPKEEELLFDQVQKHYTPEAGVESSAKKAGKIYAGRGTNLRPTNEQLAIAKRTGVPPPPEPTPVTTGGSGESGASAEAISRTAAEKRGGVKYFIEDTRTKSRTPVSSVDVNSGLRVGPGKRIIRSSPEGEFEF